MSSEVTACFWMSERVRWWAFAGVTGIAIAPDIDDMPPASLFDSVASASS